MYQGEINIKKEELSAFLKVAQSLQIRGLATDDTSNTVQSLSNRDVSRLCANSDTQNVAQSQLNTINKIGKDVELIDRRKRPLDVSKKNIKKRKPDAPPENVHDSPSGEMEYDKRNVLWLPNTDTYELVNESEDTEIPRVKQEKDDKSIDPFEETDGQSSSKTTTQQGTEFIIKRVSIYSVF